MSETLPDFFADLDNLRRPHVPVKSPISLSTTRNASGNLNSKMIVGEFLRGPVPLVWLTAVIRLPGKAPVVVGLALWFEAGRRNSCEVTLTAAILKRFTSDRKVKYRGLKSLEEAGLISIIRQPRRNPVVTILDCPDESLGCEANPCAVGELSSPSVEGNETQSTG